MIVGGPVGHNAVSSFWYRVAAVVAGASNPIIAAKGIASLIFGGQILR